MIRERLQLRVRVLSRGLCALAPALLLAGCAFLNRANTPTLNLVEENLWPETTAKRAVVFPLVFPISVAALATDAVIIHPISVIDDSARDTRDALWDDLDWNASYMTESVALPWRTVGTPVIFVSDLLLRSLFDVRENVDKARRREREEQILEILDQIEDLIDRERAGEAFDLLRAKEMEINRFWYQTLGRDEEMGSRHSSLWLEAAYRGGRYEQLFASSNPYRPLMNRKSLTERGLGVLAEMRTAPSPTVRWAAFLIEASSEMDPHMLGDLVREALRDANPVLRHEVLGWIESQTLWSRVESIENDL